MNLEQPFFLLHDRMNISSPRRFDALADRYASSEVHTSSPTLNRLHELLPQVESVCDVASGAGHTGLGFAGIAWRIVAVDPAPGMLAHPQFVQVTVKIGGITEDPEAPAQTSSSSP